MWPKHIAPTCLLRAGGMGTNWSEKLTEKESIRVLNVVAAQHARGKFLEIDVLAVARDVAMVGQSVEAGAGTTSWVKRLV